MARDDDDLYDELVSTRASYIRKPVLGVKPNKPRLHGTVKSTINDVRVQDPEQLKLFRKEVSAYNRKYPRYKQAKSSWQERVAAYNEWLERTKPVPDENVRPLSGADTNRYRTRRKRIDGMIDSDSGGVMQERNRPQVGHAGPAPWSPDYEGFKRVNKRKLKKAGYVQTQTGYVQTLGKEWDRVNKPEKKQVRLASGRMATVIDSHLGVPLGYQGPSKTITDESGLSSLDYVAKVFDGKHKTYKVEGCGHIADMEYSAYYQLLKVHFVKGDSIVVYFRVPSSVFGELYYLALNKSKQISTVDFQERHVLGIRFWDLIRIRGTLHGARYRFEYTQDYTSTGGAVGRPMGSGEFVNVQVNKQKPGRRSVNDPLGLKPGEFTNVRVPKRDILEDWNIDDLEDYFEYGNYNTHISKVKSNEAKKSLHEAYNLYNDGADEEDILNKLLRAYDYEPKSFTFIKGVKDDSD